MAMVGCVGARMEVVDGMHAGRSQRLVACREIPRHLVIAR